ncbi:MAG: 6-phosphofructokinase [Lachnospiraceae bacterium]|nr:6-phosphofructokinase [Lachnospiraceae bacterium]
MGTMIGNVLVGQSGGPTSVINSSLAGVFAGAKAAGAAKVYGMRHGIQGFLEGKVVDLDSILKSGREVELLKRTPASFLGACRFKLPAVEKGSEVYEKIFGYLRQYGIRYVFYIGGNDSMDTICKLYDYGRLIGSDICFMGVPKTIDNDLEITDHTPGFGSAAKYVATMTKEIILDSHANDVKVVTVLEIMGRNAGWLTASAALAKGEDNCGVDLIYLPELPFDADKCLASVQERMKTKKQITIAVSEGLWEDENHHLFDAISQNAKVDAFGHKELSGVGECIAKYLGKQLGCKVRAVNFSSIQRCGSHMASKTDVDEAFQVGLDAAKAASNGVSGHMTILKRLGDDPYVCVTDIYDVHKIANAEKKVPREWINENGDGMTEEFLHYVRPLIQGEMLPFMVNGLPAHLVLPEGQ